MMEKSDYSEEKIAIYFDGHGYNIKAIALSKQ